MSKFICKYLWIRNPKSQLLEHIQKEFLNEFAVSVAIYTHSPMYNAGSGWKCYWMTC